MQIKTGDTVVVIAGKDKFTKDKKGNKVQTTGKVLAVYPKTNKVLVEGVNIIKKHQKPTQANQNGGIIEKEAPIDASNVMLLDPTLNKPVRVGIKKDENGNVYKNKNDKKVRISLGKDENGNPSNYEFD